MAFIDEVEISCIAGKGGDGCSSFRREKFVPRGGPDGGDGGRGGSIIFRATDRKNTLEDLRGRHRYKAGNGTNGSSKDCHGRGADDMILEVPVGTQIFDVETGYLLADLETHEAEAEICRGGRGGRGNIHFKSAQNRTPRFAEQGHPGEERSLRLELKLLADVGLLGFPNAGKSTLISVISRAKPKIADYPFTTLEPNLGVVKLDDDNEFVVADLPGLIEGASEGLGLGDRFLRHIERARVLVYLLDLASVDGADPMTQLQVLRSELGAYRPDLLDRPSVVVGSKADVLTPEDWGDDLTVDLAISSVTNQGVRELSWRLAEMVRGARTAEPEAEGFVIHRPEPTGVEITRDDDGAWRVLGRAAERSVALSDLTDIGALDYAQHRLKKLGVDKALRRAGARDGDEVRIGAFAFEYEEDV